jgi:hypothetical protein
MDTRLKVGAVAIAAFAGLLLAQESSRDAATDSLAAAGTELAAMFGRGYDVVGSEARATLTPSLVAWLETFRDDAIARGAEPMPAELREAFDGYLPDEVLDSVRWRIDAGSVLIGQNIFQAGVRAVTLDNVILFASVEEAANAKLWAHELFHVQQYRQWGIASFVERYLADGSAIEREAWEFRWQWMKATGRVPPA